MAPTPMRPSRPRQRTPPARPWLLVLGWLAGCGPADDRLSPPHWPAGDLDRFIELSHAAARSPALVETDSVMVAGLSDPLAVRSALEALRRGGSAADAVLTSALAEVVVTAASVVSFSGEMVLTYFDASTGKVATMDATFAAVRDETDPLSIPGQETPSGRSALVPGFMAGVQAIHDRFGQLPFAQLFGPAIYFAEQGIVLDERIPNRIASRKEILLRLPEGRRLYTKPDGSAYQSGDLFRQPEVARTLRDVSRRGADYIYRGEWGRRLVEAVQREGGKLTLADLQAYRALWTEPAQTTYRGYQVFGPGLPTFGGLNTVEALNLAELADLVGRGDYTTSPDALYWLLQIAQTADLLSPPVIGGFVPPGLQRRYLADSVLTPAARLRKETAPLIWAAMQRPDWRRFRREAAAARADSAVTESLLRSWGRPPRRTAGTIAVDARGNVAVLMHSVNASYFGSGIFVDGLSVPDPGAYLQTLIASVGPGGRVPLWDNTTIVLRSGKPAFAGVGIGGAFHEVNVQNLIGMLAYGLDPQAAANRPQLRKQWPYVDPLRLPAGAGEFSAAVLEAVRRKGGDLSVVAEPAQASPGGAWVGVAIDSATGRLAAGMTRIRSGLALGY